MLRFWCLSTCRIGFQPTQWKLSHNHAYYTTSKSSSIVVPQTGKKCALDEVGSRTAQQEKPRPKDSPCYQNVPLNVSFKDSTLTRIARVQYDWDSSVLSHVTLTSRFHYIRFFQTTSWPHLSLATLVCWASERWSLWCSSRWLKGTPGCDWGGPNQKSLSEIVLTQRYCKTVTIFSAPLHICSRLHCVLSSMATSYGINWFKAPVSTLVSVYRVYCLHSTWWDLFFVSNHSHSNIKLAGWDAWEPAE